MRFSRILELVYCKPWMILPEAHLSLGKLVQSVYQRDLTKWELAEVAARPVDASRGTNVVTRQALPQMQINNGVAIVPAYGTLARGADAIEKSCGITDVEDIARDLDEAEASRDVHMIALDIDSPGGMHNGATELAYKIASLTKPTLAWTGGAMCSAAYFIGCSCDQVFASPSAMVGSIGSYIAILDSSRAYEMQGYSVEVFKSGEFKGAGIDGTALTDSQREYVQALVDGATAQFKAHVRAMRPQVKDETMDGRSFYATNPLKPELSGFRQGLIDGVENSLQAVLKQLR